ncbi:ubiquitin-protein ligase RKR1 KNAG_0J00540 [Huiozyma naganishii CBS 8797]|uniref:E3 ubiquitin-protein ligase listerin n=1 Tax=Huiozyma naganishii (strain ATCC MYA-139 / BCRC 22969 / CBS 8797 / KCTC 17520 / NBRC 10181 / NCYC 3082 / Yp74L-3) TaxID=1071383 RepID=J7S2N2_HUIN7|nr:hypothetical protein KNAG_0J00540 [Kazachstania naganishii CBS 8797]CCK72137.1 hypothetical protein KNAG_0J00540 [Kazachstania naganishii CBS 8797]
MSLTGINTFEQFGVADFGLGSNGAKITLNYFDGWPEASLLDSLGAAQLKLMFKSLSKRDEKTKEKALVELLRFVQGGAECTDSLDDIFFICWSQLYAKCTVNESKLIRAQGHHITILLIDLFKKKMAPFLKDLIPLVLLGCIDADTYVSKTCCSELRDCFNNDPQKIDALWILFHEQILNLVRHIVTIESPDTLLDERYVTREEAEFNYNRLAFGAVQLLINLLGNNPDSFGQYREQYQLLLNDDNLWKCFNLKTTYNSKLFEAILKLIAVLYEMGYLRKNKEILKLAVRRLFKAMTAINSKNSIKFAPIVPPILNILTLLDTYKEGRIWMYDKNSKDKLISLISVSYSTASLGFFTAMCNLYQQTSIHQLLDYEVEWLPLWQKSLKTLNAKPFLGRNGLEILEEFWNNYLKFLADSGDDDIKSIIQNDMLKTAESSVRLKQSKVLTLLFAAHLTPNRLVTCIEECCSLKNFSSKNFENYITLLASIPNNENVLVTLAQWSYDTISSGSPAVVENQPHFFSLFSFFLNTGAPCLAEEISKFVYEIPVLVKDSSYGKFADCIILYSNSSFVGMNDKWKESITDFFTCAFSIKVPNEKIIDTLNRLNPDVLKQLLEFPDAGEINAFITSYIETYAFNDGGALLSSPLVFKNNISLLYESAVANSRFDLFCEKMGDLKEGVKFELFEKTDFLHKAIFVASESLVDSLFVTAISLAREHTSIANKLANTIIDYVETSKDATKHMERLLRYTSDLISTNIDVLPIFIPLNLETKFYTKVPKLDYRVSLSNSFGINSHLLNGSTSSMDLALIKRFLKYSLFLDSLVTKLPSYLDSHVIMGLTLLSELAIDYNYLSDDPCQEFFNLKHTLFNNIDEFKLSFHKIIETLVGTPPENLNTLIQVLFTGAHPVIVYYKSRILYRILINEVDSISKKTLIELTPLLEKFITGVVRDEKSDDKSYLNSAILLSVLTKLNTDQSMVKLRTLLASECIGVKGPDLISKTYKTLILLTNILAIDSADCVKDDFVPLAAQRMNLVLNTMNDWMDSDIAYDPPFVVVRTALLRYFSLVLKFPAIVHEMHDSLMRSSNRLLLDSLSMCQLEDTAYIFELRASCVELYAILEAESMCSEDYSEDIKESILELTLIDFQSEADNQVSSVFYQKLNKSLQNVELKELLPHFERIFEKYLKEGMHNVNQTRVFLGLLEKLIYAKQQDAVIEFELKSGHISSESENPDDDEEIAADDAAYKLPYALLGNLAKQTPHEYLEYEDKYRFIKYLWDWTIALKYFQDVSYKLRQIYIEQLRDSNLINKMFDFIADQINLEDTKFWKELPVDQISGYALDSTQFAPYQEDIFNECRVLLGHIMYDMFNKVGALTSNWFLNIKDRSLQLKIENFVSQFISPILVAEELTAVENKMGQLTSKDDDLTIKINPVVQEVKASYLIDEQKLQISFKIPKNYPLTNIQVVGVSRVGISEQKWKQWIMSTQHVITAMNGSVLDSLELFTKNVHLQFSGFEECAICYSILHAVDRKLPNKTCPTCKNRFHGACLYKWFRSSGNNTCPLCRNEIPFRR